MIKFTKESTKKYLFFKDEKLIAPINLITSTVTNKYHIITDFIEDMSKKLGVEFDEWLVHFVTGYKQAYDSPPPPLDSSAEAENDFVFLEQNLDKIKNYVKEYIDLLDIDFSKYVNMNKVKKGSILFEEDEIKKIIIISGYLKIYSLISNSTIKLGSRLDNKIYDKLVREIVTEDIISKLYTIIKTKTFRYSLTDRYMWDYLKLMQSKTVDTYVVEIFNFIMNQILILCEVDKNPIVYFVSIVDESVKWFLRSVYKGSMTYDDSISTEDIHGMSTDNLMTYCYNDTLGTLKGIAINYLYNEVEKEQAKLFENEEKNNITDSFDHSITTIQNRISNIEYVSPVSECLTFPILSKALGIPYNHFKTLNAEHSTILSIYMKDIFLNVFYKEYSSFFNLLNCYPKERPLLITTYQIKSCNELVNDYNKKKSFYGFKNFSVQPGLISHFVGKISRCHFINVFTGKKETDSPLGKIELEISNFFVNFFAGNFEKEIEKISTIISAEF